MSRSEGCLFFDINIFLAGFMESLTWLQFSWPGSQAWHHCNHRKEGDELCIVGWSPSRLANPGQYCQHWPWRRLNAWTASLDTLCVSKSGSLGLSTGDMHPGFPAGSTVNCTHVWHGISFKLYPWEMTDLIRWMEVGREGRVIKVSLVLPFLVADSPSWVQLLVRLLFAYIFR